MISTDFIIPKNQKYTYKKLKIPLNVGSRKISLDFVVMGSKVKVTVNPQFKFDTLSF